MLCLSRKTNEVLLIGNARVQILRIRNGDVRIGIDAPANMPIFRQELFERINKEKKDHA